MIVQKNVGSGYIREEPGAAFGDVSPSHKDAEAGFSLIELIMVIVVISISAVTLMSSFSNVGTAVVLSEELQVAKLLAQECAEFIVVSRRDTVNGYGNISNASCNVLPSTTGYTRTVSAPTTTAAPCPSGATCKHVTVSVVRGGNTLAASQMLLVNY